MVHKKWGEQFPQSTHCRFDVSENQLYTIKYGDDLGEIAKKYDVTIDAIVKLNPLVIDDPDTILAGDETLNLMLTPQ